MNTHPMKIVLTLILSAAWLVSPALAGEQTAFQELSGHYEAIRLALLNDSVDTVALHAGEIATIATATTDDFSTTRAGVSDDDAEAVADLLPEISSAASALASAGDLDGARSQFFELSKPMGRYRKMAGIEGTSVLFCPMAKKAWIQPQGDVGNPYLGQGMPTCGTVVAD